MFRLKGKRCFHGAILFGLLTIGTNSYGARMAEVVNTRPPDHPVFESAHVPRIPLPFSESVPFNPPTLDEIPSGPEGDAIRFGHDIIMNTQTHLGSYVGNVLNCRNCHLAGGRIPHAGPYVGVYSSMPEYRNRSGKVTTLEMRINSCMQRSLNGRTLPYDSPEMSAMIAYMAWLSKDIPTGVRIPERGFPDINPTRQPNPTNGKKLFSTKCAMCHGGNGLGTINAPPVWGPESFNIGAGLARRGKAAAFIKKNMPLGLGGTLTDDEAYDLATFITSQSRPDFPGKIHDWPRGGKPADSPY